MIERLRRRCAELGVGLRFADLGWWGGAAALRSEYDPAVPEIVVHISTPARCIPHAIGHELYHHLEAIGRIARLRSRRERERAADEHAVRLIEELQ